MKYWTLENLRYTHEIYWCEHEEAASHRRTLFPSSPPAPFPYKLTSLVVWFHVPILPSKPFSSYLWETKWHKALHSDVVGSQAVGASGRGSQLDTPHSSQQPSHHWASRGDPMCESDRPRPPVPAVGWELWKGPHLKAAASHLCPLKQSREVRANPNDTTSCLLDRKLMRHHFPLGIGLGKIVSK